MITDKQPHEVNKDRSKTNDARGADGEEVKDYFLIRWERIKKEAMK